MPAADDLPEGLSDPDMEREYDGVGGARYVEMNAEIERRVKSGLAELR